MNIKKGIVNTCIFTLSEKTTLTPVYYLFEFICTQDNGTTTKVFLCEDISTNKLRNNEFNIEESDVENLLIGKVSLTTGSWLYNIYEQSNSSNLDLTLTGTLVENGRIDVVGDEVENEAFTSVSTIKVFNG